MCAVTRPQAGCYEVCDKQLNDHTGTMCLRAVLFKLNLVPPSTALHGKQTWSSDENSVCLSNACIVTKRKKDLSRFLYHTKYHLA